MSDSDQRVSRPVVHAFVSLNLIGGGGLLIVVVTALASRTIKRWPSWYSFCVSWIISAISYSLLTLAGQQFRSTPSESLCMIQAAAIYSAPTLTASTTLALLVHILLRMCYARSADGSEASKGTKIFLLAVPYVVWLVILIGVILFSSANPTTVEKDPAGTYCHSQDPIWRQMSSLVVLIVATTAVLVQFALGYLMYKNTEIRLDNAKLFATAIRVISFGSIGFLTLTVALAYSTQSPHQEIFDLILSTFPIMALLTFGTQKDLLNAWAFWRRKRPPPETRSSYETLQTLDRA
ncbi:hypothetical protein FA15DRAFT_755855 [Coprinopsis marcescibilis]|uniref:G-protein coupled receptors family 3 profile domain-containing protein n=1 Tax=Coprinopsis marcescibilis TaxID=230819 RepID=A0A5C3KXP0_COPMA|nr:hypothetical protein FA15DRAFT_755855 [Coprinopsis marcescibilis]